MNKERGCFIPAYRGPPMKQYQEWTYKIATSYTFPGIPASESDVRRSCSMPSKLRSTTGFFFYADYVGQTASQTRPTRTALRWIAMDAAWWFSGKGWPWVWATPLTRVTHTSQATTWRTWRTTPGYATGIALGQYRLLVTMGSLCLQHTWKHCPCAWDAGGSRCPIFALRVPCLEGSWRNAKGELGTSHWFFTYFKNGHMRLFAQTAFRAQPV